MTVVAFLRAINVGGHVVRMEQLRKLFAGLGLKDVETFIASGNVIFSSRAGSSGALERRIENQLRRSLGYDVATFIRTETEVAAIAAYQPFAASQLRSAAALNVGFLSEALRPAARKTVMAFRTDIDEFHVRGREVYWLCRRTQSDSTFSNARFEKAVARATWRGMKTVRNLAEKLARASETA